MPNKGFRFPAEIAHDLAKRRRKENAIKGVQFSDLNPLIIAADGHWLLPRYPTAQLQESRPTGRQIAGSSIARDTGGRVVQIGTAVMDCHPTCCASAAAEARRTR